MLASEFVNTMFFGMVYANCANIVKPTLEAMQSTYNRMYVHLPRVFCKDGFNISLQVNNGNYCESENGTRTFGLDWKLVEWGFPSQNIDAVKYNSEQQPTTESVGGYVDVKLLDELCEQHGGLDLQTTLSKGLYSIE